MMKVVILAGGLQSTIDNIAEGIPKPMAEIGGKPMLWHIMKNFSTRGFKEFIICGGYKVNMIKEYFKDFYIYQSDITVDLKNNHIGIHKNLTEDWKVTIVDTGIDTSPSERVAKVENQIGKENFIVTHGDCLSDIDYNELVRLHKMSDKIAMITVAMPTGRNEVLPIGENNSIMKDIFAQLPENQAWVNACCKIFNNDIFSYLRDNEDLGSKLFAELAEKNEIVTYKHKGFWAPIETKRDQVKVEALWNREKAPWKIWS